MRTRVGYAGGRTPSPTYHSLADHAETIEVDLSRREVETVRNRKAAAS